MLRIVFGFQVNYGRGAPITLQSKARPIADNLTRTGALSFAGTT